MCHCNLNANHASPLSIPQSSLGNGSTDSKWL
jgi:hypothetical protein